MDNEPPPVFVRLFGVPTLEAASGRTVLAAERPHQLLAYLACRRDWVRRDEIADLLYPAHAPAAARNNLRKVLLLAARTPGAEALEREDDRVRWLPDSDAWRFERACDDGRLADAIDLYAPPLLGGSMEAAFVDGASTWLAAERARLGERWRNACATRLAQLAGEPAEIVVLARRMLAIDPLDEAAAVAGARASLAQGHTDAAAQSLAAFRQRLANEFGAEPSAALRALETEAQLAASAARVRVAPQAGGFIGRRHELAAIAQALDGPAVRCLTLTGPGGIGKTATSRVAAAAFAARSGRRIAWVGVDDLTEVAQVPARIAGRVGFALDGTRAAWTQVAAAFGREPPLLVLDNAEHLDLGPPLTQVLEACPALKLLVTSRASVGVAGETLLAIEGLPLPDEDERDVEVLRACDSVHLFEERALAVRAAFDLAREAGAVVRLLHLVEGLPMAIELAAAWTRVLPVAQIVDELQRSVDVLDAGGARAERGLRASFDQSWRLLDSGERAALARLALLPASFASAMAANVAQAPLAVLASLVDQSLLKAEGDGRFAMHPLIRQCAAALATDADVVAQAHCAFVVARLAPYAAPAAVVPAALVKEIDDDLPHVRAAWAHALRTNDAAAIGAMAQPLSAYFRDRGLAEGIGAFDGAAQRLDRPGPMEAGTRRTLCMVLRALSGLLYLAAQVQPAEASARRLLAVAQDEGDSALVMPALNIIGLCLNHRGRFAEARPFFERALHLAEGAGIDKSAAIYSANLAGVDNALGAFADACDGFQRALALHRRTGNWNGVASTLCDLAAAQQAMGDAAGALEHLNESIVLCRQHKLDNQQATVMLNLGSVHDDLGDRDEAARWLERAWQAACERELPMVQTGSRLHQAHLDCRAGAYAAARAKVWEAFAIAERTEWQGARIGCVVAFGEIVAGEGNVAEGCEMIRWALAQDGLWRLNRDIGERHLKRLSALPAGGAPARPISATAPIAQVLARVS